MFLEGDMQEHAQNQRVCGEGKKKQGWLRMTKDDHSKLQW